MPTPPLQPSNQFAPKLAVTDVLQSDCVEWKTATEGWFQIEGARFRFQRVWLQGAVVDAPSDSRFVLDDGTGRLPVDTGGLPADNVLPSLAAGDSVVVIGRLLPGDPENPGPEALSLKANKLRKLDYATAYAAAEEWRRHLSELKSAVYLAA